jgi:hypothetical protein
MSNYDYEKQKADDARHRREIEQAAQATAHAAKKAARAAEMARLEQSASLRKQEQIAETNSFRNTVLGALPLIEQKSKNDYIVNQIKTRLSDFETGSLILKRDRVYEIIGYNGVVSKYIADFKSSNEFSETIKTINLIAEQKPKTANVIPASEIQRGNLAMVVFPLVGIIISFLVYSDMIKKSNSQTYSDSEKTILSILSILSALILGYWIKNGNKKRADDKVFVDTTEPIVNKKKNDLILELINKIQSGSDFKSIKTSNVDHIANKYFDSFVYKEILDQQSFLPDEIKVPSEFWKIRLIDTNFKTEIKYIIDIVDDEMISTANQVFKVQ